MSAAEAFRSLFDEAGLFLGGQGEVPVTFATLGGSRYPGKLHFKNGLCVRAEMPYEIKGAKPESQPIHRARYLMDFGGEAVRVFVDEGRVAPQREPADAARKTRFLSNLRLARGLFAHSPSTTNGDEKSLLRAAIWLTPRSVQDFDVADFPELGPTRQEELQQANQDFLQVARRVPANELPTSEQYREGSQSLAKILELLASYLPLPDESQQVETALRSVTFPDWVVNWNYELGNNYSDEPAIFVTLYVDERPVVQEIAKTTSGYFSVVRTNLKQQGIDRWPYISVREASQHKSR